MKVASYVHFSLLLLLHWDAHLDVKTTRWWWWCGGGEFVGYCYSVIREFAAHELTSFLGGGELRLGGGGFQGISLYETLSYIFSGIKRCYTI